MALIGNWGVRQIFKVSSQKQYTFKDFKRTVAGRWAEHSILHRKPRQEFLGPDGDTVSYVVELSAYRGLKPRTILEAMERAVREGAAEYLFIGARRVGSNKMVLTGLSETWDEIWNEGELVRCTVELTFKEYT